MVPGFYVIYAVYEFKMSSKVKSDPIILRGSKKPTWSQNFICLTWKTKNRGNNQVTSRFGKYSLHIFIGFLSGQMILISLVTDQPAKIKIFSFWKKYWDKYKKSKEGLFIITSYTLLYNPIFKRFHYDYPVTLLIEYKD